MLRIRLRRTGRKNRPSYRIVVAEHSAPIGGKFVDQLGHYDPRTKAMGLDQATLSKWLNVGAQPSNRVAKLLTNAGVKHKLVVVTQRKRRAPKHQPVDERAVATETTGDSHPATIAEANEGTETVTEEPSTETTAPEPAAVTDSPTAESFAETLD